MTNPSGNAATSQKWPWLWASIYRESFKEKASLRVGFLGWSRIGLYRGKVTSRGGSITSVTVVVYSSVTRGITPSSGTSLEDRGLSARQKDLGFTHRNW